MGLMALFKPGRKAVIAQDSQGDMPKSLLGKKCTVVGRVRSQDVDGDKAYAVLPEGRKKPKTMWESELRKKSKKQ